MKKKIFILIQVLTGIFFIHNLQAKDHYLETKKRKKIEKISTQTAQNLIPIPTNTTTVIHEIVELDKKHSVVQKQKNVPSLNLFVTNVQFTRGGIATFFSNTFNRRNYGKDFLPHCFMHLEQFLYYAYARKQSQEFVESVLRLFHQKLKSAQYVNPAALEHLLDIATPFLAEHLKGPDFTKDTKLFLSQNFKDQFEFLKQNPMAFFEDISKDIQKKVHVYYTSPDRLRSVILRFFTSCLDKTIWCPDDQEETWNSFKTLGTQLTNLKHERILTDTYDLNDLYWSLIERYCFFLDLAGSGLKLETCSLMKKDISSGKLAWLLLPEQEPGLETKTECLARAIMQAEAKAHAYEKGILTDILI